MEHGTPLSVMLIDDDEISNYVTYRMIRLHRASDTCTEYTDARSAIDDLTTNIRLNQKHLLPDVILLDLKMPGMNGVEFLEKLSSLDHPLSNELKVVILTNSELSQVFHIKQRFRQVIGCMNKPLMKKNLQDILELLEPSSKSMGLSA